MSKAKNIAFCAVMIALALALSYAEHLIPLQLVIPLPGIKLGLANVVTLVALYRVKGRYALAIVVSRCVLGAAFGGGITGLLFSLAGGSLALFTMLAARKSLFFSIYGVSVLGAAAHNIGQILAATVLLRSVYVVGYLPWLLLAAVGTGLLIGAAGTGVLHAISYATVSAPAEMCK